MTAAAVRLLYGQLYVWAAMCVGLAVRDSDPFWVIVSVGAIALALRLHR